MDNLNIEGMCSGYSPWLKVYIKFVKAKIQRPEKTFQVSESGGLMVYIVPAKSDVSSSN